MLYGYGGMGADSRNGGGSHSSSARTVAANDMGPPPPLSAVDYFGSEKIDPMTAYDTKVIDMGRAAAYQRLKDSQDAVGKQAAGRRIIIGGVVMIVGYMLLKTIFGDRTRRR